jgi:hypothetical protein
VVKRYHSIEPVAFPVGAIFIISILNFFLYVIIFLCNDNCPFVKEPAIEEIL